GVDDFDAQCVQTFANIEAALKSVGAGWSNIVQFTTYMVHSQDIPKFMKYRLREFPKMFSNGAYPPNTLLMVDRLVEEALLVEVQAVAGLLLTWLPCLSGWRDRRLNASPPGIFPRAVCARPCCHGAEGARM